MVGYMQEQGVSEEKEKRETIRTLRDKTHAYSEKGETDLSINIL